MKAWFETAEGQTVRILEPMSPVQMAVTGLLHAVGIRRIDSETIDEFVRRADLFDTYVGGITLAEIETGEKIAMTRKIVTEMIGENAAMWTDADLVDPNTFDWLIRVGKASR